MEAARLPVWWLLLVPHPQRSATSDPWGHPACLNPLPGRAVRAEPDIRHLRPSLPGCCWTCTGHGPCTMPPNLLAPHCVGCKLNLLPAL